MVRAGRYKKLSASLYAPDSPANPSPGAWYLRHVGFLGAQPPAIKGLAPVNFAAGDEEGTVTVEFSEEMGFISRLVGLLRGVRDYITERDGAGQGGSGSCHPGRWTAFRKAAPSLRRSPSPNRNP